MNIQLTYEEFWAWDDARKPFVRSNCFDKTGKFCLSSFATLLKDEITWVKGEKMKHTFFMQRLEEPNAEPLTSEGRSRRQLYEEFLEHDEKKLTELQRHLEIIGKGKIGPRMELILLKKLVSDYGYDAMMIEAQIQVAEERKYDGYENDLICYRKRFTEAQRCEALAKDNIARLARGK